MSRRSGPTLRERGLAVPPEPVALEAEVDPDRPRPVTRRHCWVTGLPDSPGRRAGLLVEWRREPGGDGWAARVVYVLDDAGSTVLVEAWVPARHLEPATG